VWWVALQQYPGDFVSDAGGQQSMNWLGGLMPHPERELRIRWGS
jgi:hypothetical protein